MRPARAILGSLLMATLLAGCEPIDPSKPAPAEAKLHVALFTDSQRLTEFTPATSDPAALTRDKKAALLTGARNETVAFQALIDAKTGTPEVGITPEKFTLDSDPAVTLPASAVRLFRELPIRVEAFPPWLIRLTDAPLRAGNYYDPLVEIGDPFPIRVDGRLAIWCDVHIPAGATPGRYTGRIKVQLASGLATHLPIVLHVRGFTLPPAPAMLCLGQFDHAQLFTHLLGRLPRHIPAPGVDPGSPIHAARKTIHSFCRTAQRHGLDLFDLTLHPKLAPDKDAGLRVNFASFDTMTKPLRNAKPPHRPLRAWPMPTTTTWPNPAHFGSMASRDYPAAISTILRAFNRHFHLAGSRQSLFAFPAPIRSTNFVTLASILHASDPDLPILSLTCPPAGSAHWRYVHMLAPPAEQFSPALAARLRPSNSPLAGLYLRPTTPPFLPPVSPLAQGGDLRALCWFAKKYAARGVLLGNVVAPDARDVHSGKLFYLSSQGSTATILPSVTLKYLRRGMNDLAYIKLLEAQKRPTIARAVLNTMVRFGGSAAAGDSPSDPRLGGWVRSTPLWERIHAVLGDEVAKGFASAPRTPQEQLADRVLWQQLGDALCNIAVERVQTRLRSATAPSRGMRVDVDVTLFNQYASGRACTISLANLPKGARAISPQRTLPRIGSHERATFQLGFSLDRLPISKAGKIPFALRIQQPGGKTRLLPVSAAVLIAQPTLTPPTIDGVLNDWPAAPANTGGQFALLGRRGTTPKPLAINQTRVSVLQDETYLYFAIRCAHPNPAAIRSLSSNRLHYEQLLALGEESIEILLDPGCGAKSPEDLYHIAIKPSGVVIEELGIGSTPPLGRHRRTPLRSRLAAKTTKTEWIVELRIPKSAFGVGGKQTIWGLNIMRFSPKTAEASSWVRAGRHFYSPSNLGTLFVFPPPKR